MIEFQLKTIERNEMINIDSKVQKALHEIGATYNVATIFCPHTTAAITINENGDPNVCLDWIENLNILVPANQPYYRHAEGNSDSHVKASLIGPSEQVIVRNGEMTLGTWQSIYFCEFDGPRERTVYVSLS